MNVAGRLAKIEQTMNPEPRQRGPFDGFAKRMRAAQAAARSPVSNPRPGSLAARMRQRRVAGDLV